MDDIADLMIEEGLISTEYLSDSTSIACTKSRANVFCINCEEPYCHSCFKSCHAAGLVLASHACVPVEQWGRVGPYFYRPY